MDPQQETEGRNPDLMDRASQLFQEFKGPKWSKIAKTIEREGYFKDGKVLSSNTIRKRFQKDPVLKKLLADYRQGKTRKDNTPKIIVPKAHLEKKPAPSLSRIERDNITNHTDDTVTAKELLSLLQGSMQRRDEILIEQIRKSNTGGNMEVLLQIEDRMAKKMNQELESIKDELEQIEARLEMLVETRVEENLRSLVTPGGSFAKDLQNIIDQILDRKLSGRAGNIIFRPNINTRPRIRQVGR